MNDFVFGLISKKRKQMFEQKNYDDKEDIRSRFLVESKKDPERMTDQYLRDIILNFMIAGKDTTAGTLSWFFYLLCKHPLVQEKVAEEVREVINCKENETNIEAFLPSGDSATNLPFLGTENQKLTMETPDGGAHILVQVIDLTNSNTAISALVDHH